MFVCGVFVGFCWVFCLFVWVCLGFFVETNTFGCAFVPSYTAFSEDTGWDGLILPVPEYSFEGLFRTVSCHLQTQCVSPGDVPEKLRRVLHHRDV